MSDSNHIKKKLDKLSLSKLDLPVLFDIIDSDGSDEELEQIAKLDLDIYGSSLIIEKAKNSKEYAQSLYAALCNNSFQKLDTWPLLNDNTWSCTWRYAGGIIANLLDDGTYMDWYCSGNEGIVSDEIKQDLNLIGWQVIENDAQ